MAEETAKAHPRSYVLWMAFPTTHDSEKETIATAHRIVRFDDLKSPTSRWKGKRGSDQMLAHDTPDNFRLSPTLQLDKGF